jgi:hypothetical protein
MQPQHSGATRFFLVEEASREREPLDRVVSSQVHFADFSFRIDRSAPGAPSSVKCDLESDSRGIAASLHSRAGNALHSQGLCASIGCCCPQCPRFRSRLHDSSGFRGVLGALQRKPIDPTLDEPLHGGNGNPGHGVPAGEFAIAFYSLAADSGDPFHGGVGCLGAGCQSLGAVFVTEPGTNTRNLDFTQAPVLGAVPGDTWFV